MGSEQDDGLNNEQDNCRVIKHAFRYVRKNRYYREPNKNNHKKPRPPTKPKIVPSGREIMHGTENPNAIGPAHGEIAGAYGQQDIYHGQG